MIELARTDGAAVGRSVKVLTIDRGDVDNIRRQVVNIEKIRRMLPSSLQVTLEVELARTAAWFAEDESRLLVPAS